MSETSSLQPITMAANAQTAAYSLLRKTLDVEKNLMLQLLQSLPQAPAAESNSVTDHRIDFYA
jgi:hypothetical protein